MTFDKQARKHELIVKAIGVFALLGYNNVTFAILAERTGTSRTLLYRYFRDKRQIFDSAISELIGRIAKRHSEIVRTETTATMRLRRICTAVIATLFDNHDFLGVIIDFVMYQKHTGNNVSRRIKRFTMGIKRTLHTLLIWGVHRREFRPDTDADVTTDLLYAQFESAVLRLTVTDDAEQTAVLDRIDAILKGIMP